MATKNTSTPAQPKQRLGNELRILGIGLIAMVAVVVVALLGVNQHKLAVAKRDVTTARLSNIGVADNLFDKKIAALNELKLIGPELASSKTDVCYVTHRDAGWFAHSWYQDCYIRHLSGYVATADRATTVAQVEGSLSATTQFGSASGNGCELFADRYIPTLIYRPANTPLDSSDCALPSQLQGLWSVKGPIMSDRELSAKQFRGFNPGAVNNGVNQIWIMQDKHYYHEDLGCGFELIFCGNPRSRAVTAG